MLLVHDLFPGQGNRRNENTVHEEGHNNINRAEQQKTDRLYEEVDGKMEEEEQGTEGQEVDEVYIFCFKAFCQIHSAYSLYQLQVENVTPSSKSKRTSIRNGTSKVLLTDFENTKLAIFAKRSARMSACIDNMFPEETIKCWSTFEEEMERLSEEGRAQSFLESLDNMSNDPDARDQLLRFVSDFDGNFFLVEFTLFL